MIIQFENELHTKQKSKIKSIQNKLNLSLCFNYSIKNNQKFCFDGEIYHCKIKRIDEPLRG